MIQRKLLNSGFVKLDGYTGETLSYENFVLRFRIKCPVALQPYWSYYGKGTLSPIHSNHVEFYTPAYFQNRKGETLSETICNELSAKFQNFHIWLYNFYRKLLEQDVTAHQVRMMLPQSQFVEFYWTVSAEELSNDNFTCLRNSNTYPLEIRQYASAVADIFAEVIKK